MHLRSRLVKESAVHGQVESVCSLCAAAVRGEHENATRVAGARPDPDLADLRVVGAQGGLVGALVDVLVEVDFVAPRDCARCGRVTAAEERSG